jgi:cyclase
MASRAAVNRRLERRRLLRAGAMSLGAALLPMLNVRGQQSEPASGLRNTAPDIPRTDLGSGLVLLRAPGCNVLALHGDDGALMVDGGPAASADVLLRAVFAATGNDRIHTLVNTHGHPEQTGANELVGRAGGVILAHENTKLFVSHAVRSALFQGKLEPLPEAAWPTQTTRGDGSLDFAGGRIDYGYLPAAHTDGDLFVHFPQANVLAAGGVVSGERWPLLDYRNGAWFGGRVRALERLAGIVKADTRVVPADGPLITGQDIVRLRDIYRELFPTMIGFMNMGLGAEDVVPRKPLEPYEAEFGDASTFIDGAYRSMQIAYVPD